MGDGAVTSPLPRPESLKAIVFDLDGTLYRDDRLGEEVNQSAIRYVAALRLVDMADAEAMLQRARVESGDGGTLSRAVVALGGNLPEMHRRFAQEIHPDQFLKRDERVPQLLKLLATRFQLYLYTNNNRDLSGRIMAQLGVTGLFRKIFTIEDYWLPKPDPKLINDILTKIAVKPAEALFVGDRYEVDLLVPASIGCPIFESKTVEELLTLEQLVH
uniref:phosphoglycolate phosphatase n=1 Tax=Geobacter sp. (strain M21) TaxID=443144 RepID=C6E4H8_GEOSM